jgi:hypothetical protein
MDKIIRYGRTAAVSTAFRQCMARAMTSSVTRTYGGTFGPYRRCTGDPWYGSTQQKQLDKIVDMSLSLNDLHVNCSGGSGNASVAGSDQHGYMHAHDETFSWAGWFANVQAQVGQPACTGVATPPGCRYLPYPWPYTQAAGITWHEVSHTHGYTHGANDQAGALPACGYAGDATWHFQRNTMPYIVGDCIEEVLARSGARCGAHVEGDLENCGTGRLRLVEGFDATTCTCVRDPATSSDPFLVEARHGSTRELINRTTCSPSTVQGRVVPLDASCTNAQLTLWRGSTVLASANVPARSWATFSVGSVSGRLKLRATCGGVTRYKVFNRDTAAPSFSAAAVGSSSWTNNPPRLLVQGLSDDGWWLGSEYRTWVNLDGAHAGTFDGVGADLGSLSEGAHSARVWVRDACNRWSGSRNLSFNVDTRPPTVSFKRPSSGAVVARNSSLTVEVIAGDPGLMPLDRQRLSGLASVRLYLDDLPGELSGGQLLCTFPGPWMLGFASSSSCTVTASWPYGAHKLVAIARDRAGNETRVERDITVWIGGGYIPAGAGMP